jgi:hypothetical protein
MRVRRGTLLGFVASFASASLAAQAPAPSPLPPVSEHAYRVEPSTGTLTPLEQVKEKGQERTGWSEYRYLEGAQSSVSMPGDETLQFVIRVDGSARTLKDRRSLCHFLERLVPGEDRRYRSDAKVRIEQEFSEIVPGLDPRKPKNGTLRIALRVPGTLPPGEYAVVLGTCGQDMPMPGPQYGAFHVAAARP